MNIRKKPVYLSSIRALRVRPGDRIVISTTMKLTDFNIKRIKELAGGTFPGHEIIVLEDGMKIGVIRPG